MLILGVSGRSNACKVPFPYTILPGVFCGFLPQSPFSEPGCGRSTSQKTSLGRHGSLAAVCMEVRVVELEYAAKDRRSPFSMSGSPTIRRRLRWNKSAVADVFNPRGKCNNRRRSCDTTAILALLGLAVLHGCTAPPEKCAPGNSPNNLYMRARTMTSSMLG